MSCPDLVSVVAAAMLVGENMMFMAHGELSRGSSQISLLLALTFAFHSLDNSCFHNRVGTVDRL